MDLNTTHYQFTGFISSGAIGFIHFQDVAMAVVLGFFGALGAYLFKIIVDKKRK